MDAAETSNRYFVSDWPGLSPASLLRKRGGTALPFPLSAPRQMHFFRARNAIYHLIRSLGLTNGEAVLVPDYHSGSEVWAIRAAGASVRYFHIDTDLEPDLEDVRRICEVEKPRVLLTIHYNGWPQPIDEIAAICREHGIILIEDCAHAMFSAKGTRPLGSYGDYSVFCLYKSVPVPNGGVLVCNGEMPRVLAELQLESAGFLSVSRRAAELILTWFRTQAPAISAPMLAMKRTAGRLLDGVHLRRMPIGEVGFDTTSVNAAISPMSLAIVASLDVETIVRRRRENFLELRRRLAEHADLLRTDLPDGVCPLFFPILVSDKQAAAAALRARWIAAIETWNYGDSDATGPGFEGAQFLRDHVLELPIHPDLTKEHLDHIVAEVIGLT